MSDIWVYPAWFNKMNPDSNIKIVEKCYNEPIRKEIDSYLNEIETLQKENAKLRECVERIKSIGDKYGYTTESEIAREILRGLEGGE